MLRRLGDYPLRSVTISYNGSEVQLSQTKESQYVDVRQVPTRHVKMLYVEICRGRLCRGLDLSKSMLNLLKQSSSRMKCYTLSKFDDMPTVCWIIPPSLRNNGLHCVFVQVRKFVGCFSSRVPFSLHGELSSFSHLKQGNGVRPCMAYASSHNGVAKKRFLKIWMDVFGF